MQKDKLIAHRTADPEAKYRSPMDLADDATLPHSQRIEMLERWEFTVNARLTAGDEGMPTQGTEARDSELVRDIGKARARLLGET